MAKHEVKCKKCGQIFDANKIEYIKEKNRYSHKDCPEPDLKVVKENDEKQQLADFIMDTFGEETYKDPKIWVQFSKYYKEGTTPKEIYNTLYYIYNIKHKSLKNNNFGLIPYYLKEANDYFSKIDKAQKINEEKLTEKDFSQLNVIEITIKSPQRKKNKQSLFSFLDREE